MINFKHIRNSFACSAAAIALASGYANFTSASASPQRVAADTWSAYDDQGQEHVIKVNHQDKEGDYMIEVRIPDQYETTYYWIDCKRDWIHAIGDDDWDVIDHRKMEGWYSDVACRLN